MSRRERARKKGRNAPKGGYAFQSKSEYRQEVWTRFGGFLKNRGKDRCDANVLLMPSREGIEINLALGLGYLPGNLHIVDHNPAIVASLNRKHGNSLNGYGVDVADVGRRLSKKKIVLDCANLDMTGCLSQKTLHSIKEFLSSVCLSPVSCMALTLLRGREQNSCRQALADPLLNILQLAPIKKLLRGLSTEDIRRIMLVCSYVSEGTQYSLWPFSAGSYRSVAGSQTMLFFLARIVKNAEWDNLSTRVSGQRSKHLREKIMAAFLGMTCHELRTFFRDPPTIDNAPHLYGHPRSSDVDYSSI